MIKDELPINLKSLNDMDKLCKKINYGKLDATFDLHNGSIVAVQFHGQQRLLYNRTVKDSNTNEVAVKDILTRIAQALENDDISELNFSIKTHNRKVKSVAWASQVKKRYNVKEANAKTTKIPKTGDDRRKSKEISKTVKKD